MKTSEEPALSIVIASGQPWPEARLPLESLRPQLEEMDGRAVEIIFGLADSLGMDPAYADSYPSLRTFCEPGASVFWLRTQGIAMARGRIIAITEDQEVDPILWTGFVTAKVESGFMIQATFG